MSIDIKYPLASGLLETLIESLPNYKITNALSQRFANTFSIHMDPMMINTLANHQGLNNIISDIIRDGIHVGINEALPDFRDSLYFPAARTGIITSHRILAANIISNISRFGIEEPGILTFNQIARDFLSRLVTIGDIPPSRRMNNSAGERIAQIIKTSVLDGEVVVSTPQLGLPNFSYRHDDTETPVDRSSSMVTELAPIVMFLRYHVRMGDIVIIDEPEAHLHPAAQQQMAAALVLMVRFGIRVLITTHSHYMVEQLSNFVNASKLHEDTRRKVLDMKGGLGEEDIYLEESETAIYSFIPSTEHGGSIVNEVQLGEDYEYSPEDHTLATVNQFNRLQAVLEAREQLEAGEQKDF